MERRLSVSVNLQRNRKTLNQSLQHVIVTHKEIMMQSGVSVRKCCFCVQDGRQRQDPPFVMPAYSLDLVPTLRLYLVHRGTCLQRSNFTFFSAFSAPTVTHTPAQTCPQTHTRALTQLVRDLWLVVNTQKWGFASSVVWMSTQQLWVCVTARERAMHHPHPLSLAPLPWSQTTQKASTVWPEQCKYDRQL